MCDVGDALIEIELVRVNPNDFTVTVDGHRQTLSPVLKDGLSCSLADRIVDDMPFLDEDAVHVSFDIRLHAVSHAVTRDHADSS